MNTFKNVAANVFGGIGVFVSYLFAFLGILLYTAVLLAGSFVGCLLFAGIITLVGTASFGANSETLLPTSFFILFGIAAIGCICRAVEKFRKAF